MAAEVALGESPGTARPASGDADGPVPEAGPGQVEARLADRRLLRHHRLDSHRAGIRIGQGRRRPLSTLAAEATAVPAHAEETKAVGGMRGHEGAIDEARSAAESLEAPELPMPDTVRFQPPHHPRPTRPWCPPLRPCGRPGANGSRVGMSSTRRARDRWPRSQLFSACVRRPGGPRRATEATRCLKRACGLLHAKPPVAAVTRLSERNERVCEPAPCATTAGRSDHAQPAVRQAPHPRARRIPQTGPARSTRPAPRPDRRRRARRDCSRARMRPVLGDP
jgi:hypothetical protein